MRIANDADLAALAASGALQGIERIELLAAQLRLPPASVERFLIWLLKYDFIRRV